MPGDSKTTLSFLTGEAILAGAFDRLRPRLLAMIGRRIGSKLAMRIDPEGMIQEAFLRARPRWQALTPKPDDVDAWVYGQVLDRLIELVRVALGPEHNVDRDRAWPDGSVAPMAEHLVDSQTGPSTALSRAERREVVLQRREARSHRPRDPGLARLRRPELYPDRRDLGPEREHR